MDNFRGRWYPRQFLWKNSLERVAENDKGEGDKLGDYVCLRNQKRRVWTGSE